MGYGVARNYAGTMASADSIVTFNLQRSFSKVYLQIPTMTSYSAFDAHGSIDGTTYYPIYDVNMSRQARTFAKTMASIDSVVSFFNFGRIYSNINLQIQTFVSAANIEVQGSVDGTNFYPIRVVSPTTQAVQSTFLIAATAVVGNFVPIPGGYQYLKLVADSAPTTTMNFKATVYNIDNQISTFSIANSFAINGAILPIPGGFQYYKFLATDSAPTAATVFQMICGD